MNYDDRGSVDDILWFQAWLQTQRDERSEEAHQMPEETEGWERVMAAAWAAYFMALSQGNVQEHERKAFMEFVALVSTPILLPTGGSK